MSGDGSGLTLYEGLTRSGLTYEELWLAQLGLGGNADSMSIEAYVLGVLRPDSHQHNLLAQALNEHFLEIGADHPVAYAERSVT
jgi:hypothetical protein